MSLRDWTAFSVHGLPDAGAYVTKVEGWSGVAARLEYVGYVSTVSAADLKAWTACNLPKLFLRLLTKFETSDFPMALAKWFFDDSLIDHKEVAFYHRH